MPGSTHFRLQLSTLPMELLDMHRMFLVALLAMGASVAAALDPSAEPDTVIYPDIKHIMLNGSHLVAIGPKHYVIVSPFLISSPAIAIGSSGSSIDTMYAEGELMHTQYSQPDSPLLKLADNVKAKFEAFERDGIQPGPADKYVAIRYTEQSKPARVIASHNSLAHEFTDVDQTLALVVDGELVSGNKPDSTCDRIIYAMGMHLCVRRAYGIIQVTRMDKLQDEQPQVFRRKQNRTRIMFTNWLSNKPPQPSNVSSIGATLSRLHRKLVDVANKNLLLQRPFSDIQ